jgi:hypothetical protein
MSLDVYLTLPNAQQQSTGSGIFIREDGQTKEISRAEWDARYPDREPITVLADFEDDSVYSANITHNLGKMASEAGIYEVLWRPEECNFTKAAHLIEPLQTGLGRLQSNPERFRILNPENGWGTYEGLMRFVADYLAACMKHPTADVSVSR